MYGKAVRNSSEPFPVVFDRRNTVLQQQNKNTSYYEPAGQMTLLSLDDLLFRNW